MNTLFVLLDGMEDHPNPDLGGKKPYEIADMGFMRSDVKTKARTTGRGYTQLFLNEFFTGKPPALPRAVLEAIGLGMDVSNGRAAYRLSPAEICDGMIRWCYHPETFSSRLKSTIMKNFHLLEKHNAEIKFFISGRAVITMESDDVPELPGPPVDTPFVEIPGDLGGLIMRVCEEMDGITDYPWGCGKYTEQYPPFKCLDNLTAFSDSPTSLGICASLGYKTQLIRDVDSRFPAAREALEHGNVFLHIDEVDEYSHMRDPRKKINLLEHVDRMMEKHFSDANRIVYFVDHGTSSITGEHLPIEVPFWSNYETSIKEDELVPLNTMLPRLME